MFNVGEYYPTVGGGMVLVVDAKSVGNPFHRVLGEDELWRDVATGKVVGERQGGKVNPDDFKVATPKASKPEKPKPKQKPDFWGKNKSKRRYRE